MLFLYTDFGVDDPYVGQVHAALAQYDAQGPTIDLLHNAPNFNIRASAYLLAALAEALPTSCTVLAVVDPGVGGERAPLMVRTGRRWWVGPDNGLLSVVMARAGSVACHRIDWRPPRLSSSFHGRDLFAPVAAMLSRGEMPSHTANYQPMDSSDWPTDLAQVIYIDHYGNAMTGLRANQVREQRRLKVHRLVLEEGTTFSTMPAGKAFWYCNANGLVEIAMNQANVADQLGLTIGTSVALID